MHRHTDPVTKYTREHYKIKNTTTSRTYIEDIKTILKYSSILNINNTINTIFYTIVNVILTLLQDIQPHFKTIRYYIPQFHNSVTCRHWSQHPHAIDTNTITKHNLIIWHHTWHHYNRSPNINGRYETRPSFHIHFYTDIHFIFTNTPMYRPRNTLYPQVITFW